MRRHCVRTYRCPRDAPVEGGASASQLRRFTKIQAQSDRSYFALSETLVLRPVKALVQQVVELLSAPFATESSHPRCRCNQTETYIQPNHISPFSMQHACSRVRCPRRRKLTLLVFSSAREVVLRLQVSMLRTRLRYLVGPSKELVR